MNNGLIFLGMDEGLLLGLIGIVITLIIGYIGFRMNIKSRKKTSVAFAEIDNIRLFKSIVKNLDSLEIRYKNIPIKENLILIKASIVNNGTNDIDKSMIHQPITILLNDEYKCIEVNINEKSKDVIGFIKSESKSIIVEWDLLKKNEFISFDILIEENSESSAQVDQNENEWFKRIEQRITNLDEIKKIQIAENYLGISRNITSLSFKLRRTFPLFFVTMGIYFICVSLLFFNDHSISYAVIENGNKSIVHMSAKNKDEIRMRSEIDSLNGVYPVKELNQKFKFEIILENRGKRVYVIFTSIGISFLIIGLVLFYFRRAPESDRIIRKILKRD